MTFNKGITNSTSKIYIMRSRLLCLFSCLLFMSSSSLFAQKEDNKIENVKDIGQPTSVRYVAPLSTRSNLIIADLGDWNQGNYAAKRCVELSDETGCDWYLPAEGELNAVFQQLGPSGNNNFVEYFYWSSTQVTYFGAWGTYFDTGIQYVDHKPDVNRCRCVRR